MAARRGAQGARQVAADGFVAAGFVHRSSRAGDPQLHTHMVAANLVHGADGAWSAIDARVLFRHARTAGFLYEAALRAELTWRLGWEWGPVRNGIAEPAGFTRAQLDAFSRRRDQIRAAMDAAGVSSPRSAQVATLATRGPKDLIDAPGGLVADWHRRGAEHGLGPTQSGPSAGTPSPPGSATPSGWSR